ncbi:MAG: bifunctional 2-polyprenyl-6-hydroxyphenol methylase/3-demethylubiquinol 3-O-methyltransferase UbiG [Gammaproteobacteria bacterium]|nr:bifunctional 2-polyprenyl-6-hydroxyphenol methylase/3-demethylubiquinol 3-O-methyltransferase UbiG [Gammaproteobacteria bacterium]
MTEKILNIDKQEQEKFDSLAPDWWNIDGQFKTLHDINPVRLDYIDRKISLAGKTVLDLGCGGGLLSEAMAKKGAHVTGLDISEEPLAIARKHCQQTGLDIQYINAIPEDYATRNEHRFDVVTCMEMLEHVPNPESIIQACARLIKTHGHVIFSTINRTPRAYLFAVLMAEHLLKILPPGTHDYARFIRPSELAVWCERQGLCVKDIAGMAYIPFLGHVSINKNPGVNYLMHASRSD